jgi:FkbM family methyltransferase
MAHRRRFDIVEVGLVTVLVLVLGTLAGRWFVLNRHESFVSPRDLAWLRDRYGSHKWSENAEEWIVRDFFQDMQGGTFVDIGSADARRGSNTYFLESHLKWTGVAVDALSEYGASYREFRPNTRFFALFVSDRSDTSATMYVSRRYEQYSSKERAFTMSYTPEEPVARAVATISLDDLIRAADLETIDFLSIDIELSEPQALAGFDIEAAAPRLVCIEAHPETRQAILDYFARHKYVIVGKYLRIDNTNLWFAPLAQPSNVP